MTLWQRVLEFNDRYFSGWREIDILYWPVALAGEVGEICNALKHLVGGGTNRQGDVSYKDVVVEECVDASIYVILLLEALGVTEEKFNEAIDAKFEKLKVRMETMEAKGAAIKFWKEVE